MSVSSSAASRLTRNARPRAGAGFWPVRVLVFVLCLLPLARLFWLGSNDQLSANPVEFVTRSTGTWTLVMLCLTLAVTPLRRLPGLGWLLRTRRMLGLFTFFYVSLHLTTYIWLDQWFAFGEIVRDVFKRPFITAGFAAFLMMVPLALTSNGWAMRRLGRRWQQLHRLIYPIALVGLLHFWWHKAGKLDFFEPVIYAVVIFALLGLRLFWRAQGRRAHLARARATQA